MQDCISIGNKVDMELLVGTGSLKGLDKHRVLTSKVMDVVNDNTIRIAMPFSEGRIVPLSVGERYQVSIFSSKGLYGSNFLVVNRLKENNLFLADLELMAPLQKMQRREFFRHDCRLSAKYRMLSEDMDQEEQDEIEWKKCVIMDISGGGIRMVSEFQEDVEMIAQVRIPLYMDGEVQILTENGKLISSVRKQAPTVLYEQRIEFEQIGEQDREQIIRYIFGEERKKISKEKGLD